MDPKNLSKEEMFTILETMLLSRHFEEKVNEMFMQGKIHGTTHLGLGEEACHAGVSLGLDKDDWILPTHRGHGHCLAKGADPYAMFCELFANTSGLCKGMGGSMHLTDIENHNTGNSGIVAGAVPIAVGVADALKRKKSKEIALVFFGDGASSQGMTLESLNLASVWKAPLIFCCENNRYGMSTPAKKTVSVENVSDRAEGFGMPGKTVDGMDVLAVMEGIQEAAEYVRSGKGPYLIELKTYRYLGHSKSDQRKYRTKEEENDIKENHDAIKNFKKYMIEKGVITEEEFKEVDKKMFDNIEEAANLAQQDTSCVSMDDAFGYVYAQ